MIKYYRYFLPICDYILELWLNIPVTYGATIYRVYV